MFKSFLRKQTYILLSLLSMAVLITFSSCDRLTNNNSAGGALPAEFRVGYQLTAGPETLVKQLGLIEEKYPDVPIRWQAYDSGLGVNDAIASGNIDAGLIGSVPVATGIAKDLPYQVYFILNILGDSEALAVTEASSINSPADLPGKTIAVPFGSTTHFSLLAGLNQNDIDPDSVQVLDMQPQDLLAAWQMGEIDGGFVWQPTLSRMLDDGGSVLITAGQLAENGAITADLGVASKAFAAQYPEFLTGYVEALDTAVRLYREDPTAAAAAMSVALALSPEESMKAMDELVWLTAEEQRSEKYLGTVETAGALSQVLKDSADFLVEQGELPAAPNLDVYEQGLFREAIANAAS